MAVVIGNALKWYDFISFGFFIAIISRLFGAGMGIVGAFFLVEHAHAAKPKPA